MAYTQKLSEQLATKYFAAVDTGSLTVTSDIIDMKDYHRMILLVDLHETAATTATASTTSGTSTVTSTTSITAKVASLTVSASTSSAFGGTAVALTTGAMGLGTGTASSFSTTFASKVTASATTTCATGMCTSTVTSTASIDQHLEAEIPGGYVQGLRAAEDRYVRAKVKLTGLAGYGTVHILADTARAKPA